MNGSGLLISDVLITELHIHNNYSIYVLLLKL